MIYRRRKNNSHKIAAGVLALILGFMVYDYATRPASALDQNANLNLAANVTDIDSESLARVQKIKSITLDEKVFTDIAFTTLEDRTITITPEPIGRNNPFAPLGILQISKPKTVQTTH
jgi:hypothetical protein